MPKRVLYDNLKSAVLVRREDAIRFNPDPLELAAYYRYEPRPVAVYRDNEKGRVEATIRRLRTSFITARPWTAIDDLNRQASLWCRREAGDLTHHGQPELTVDEAWALEKSKLLSLPNDACPANEEAGVRVGKTPYARFDCNDYSVPHYRVRRPPEVRATSERVHLFDGPDCVAEHTRTFDKGAQV